VLTDPDQYGPYLEKLQSGTWSLEDRRRCAV
jgi:hypothetical protein